MEKLLKERISVLNLSLSAEEQKNILNNLNLFTKIYILGLADCYKTFVGKEN